MVHNRCSASFADAVGLVSSGRDIFAGSVAVHAGAAARAHAAAAMRNSAGVTIPGDTGWHAAPDLHASRAAGCLYDRNKRAQIVVAASRLADRADVSANPESVDSVAADVAVVAVLCAAVHAGDFVPVVRAAGPDSAGCADDFVPSVVAAGCAAGPDSAGFFDLAVRAGDFGRADLTQLAALRVGLHAAAVVRRAVGRLVADHSGVDSGAPVEFAVAAPAVAVALRDVLPGPLVACPSVPEFRAIFLPTATTPLRARNVGGSD